MTTCDFTAVSEWAVLTVGLRLIRISWQGLVSVVACLPILTVLGIIGARTISSSPDEFVTNIYAMTAWPVVKYYAGLSFLTGVVLATYRERIRSGQV